MEYSKFTLTPNSQPPVPCVRGISAIHWYRPVGIAGGGDIFWHAFCGLVIVM
jgi:hypothetical protein